MLTDEEIEGKMKTEYQLYLADEAKLLQLGGFSREEIDEILTRHKSTLGPDGAAVQIPAATETPED